jgi:hypothetical protein
MHVEPQKRLFENLPRCDSLLLGVIAGTATAISLDRDNKQQQTSTTTTTTTTPTEKSLEPGQHYTYYGRSTDPSTTKI